MSKTKVVLSVCFVTILTAVAWPLAHQGAARARVTPDRQELSSYYVDRAARNIGSGDEHAIRSLLNEVFAEKGIDDSILQTAGSVPDRLVAAEARFQKTGAGGVNEENVVEAVNQLARQFNAPLYAYTNLAELRKLRLRMLITYPGFTGRGSAATRDDFTPHFERSMSPIEAFHCTATLIFQKLTNPEFQLALEETESQANGTDAGTSPIKQRIANGERTQELLGVVARSTASMSLRDTLELSEQTLDRLAIQR